jgi:ABC-2 type transport system permease protein
VNPLIWLVAFGGGLGASISFGGADYQSFIFPGVIMMTALFSSIFFGMYIVWDKKIDFFKEVLVAPLSRTTLFAGKMLGGCTDALIQSAILIALGPIFGVSLHALRAGGHRGLSVRAYSGSGHEPRPGDRAQMSSFEGFGLIQSFVVMPLFFLSGALYPIDSLPLWLKGIT